MPKGSRGGQGGGTFSGPTQGQLERWGQKGEGDSEVAESENPFVRFRKYRKQFYALQSIEEVRAILDNNGVGMSNAFVNYVNKGEVGLEDAKQFIGGAMEVLSKFGGGDTFRGFNAARDSRAAAWYSPMSRTITMEPGIGRGYTGRVVGGGGKENAYTIGGHEAGHHISHMAAEGTGTQGKWKSRGWLSEYAVYTENVVNRAYERYKGSASSNGGKPATRKAVMSGISTYAVSKGKSGRYMYGETVSEAINDVWRNGLKATRFSKEIYQVLRRDMRGLK